MSFSTSMVLLKIMSKSTHKNVIMIFFFILRAVFHLVDQNRKINVVFLYAQAFNFVSFFQVFCFLF